MSTTAYVDNCIVDSLTKSLNEEYQRLNAVKAEWDAKVKPFMDLDTSTAIGWFTVPQGTFTLQVVALRHCTNSVQQYPALQGCCICFQMLPCVWQSESSSVYVPNYECWVGDILGFARVTAICKVNLFRAHFLEPKVMDECVTSLELFTTFSSICPAHYLSNSMANMRSKLRCSHNYRTLISKSRPILIMMEDISLQLLGWLVSISSMQYLEMWRQALRRMGTTIYKTWL